MVAVTAVTTLSDSKCDRAKKREADSKFLDGGFEHAPAIIKVMLVKCQGGAKNVED
jgi:hypothetical protein